MILRYLCRITELGESAIGDAAFDYFEAFAQTGRKLRILSPELVDFIKLEHSRWNMHGAAFLEPLEKDFINIVCASIEDLAKFYTHGVVNLGITIAEEWRKDVPDELTRYDAVLCPSMEDADYLRRNLRMPALHLPPQREKILDILRTLERKGT